MDRSTRNAFTLRNIPADSFSFSPSNAMATGDPCGLVQDYRDSRRTIGGRRGSNMDVYQKCHKPLSFSLKFWFLLYMVAQVLRLMWCVFFFCAHFALEVSVECTDSVRGMGDKSHFPSVFARELYCIYWGLSGIGLPLFIVASLRS